MSHLRPYMDLSEHYFYPDEKKLVCQHIEEGGLSIRKFAEDHKLKKSRIGKWMKHWKAFKSSGIDKFGEDKPGRPPKMDQHGSLHLCDFLKQGRRSQQAPTAAELNSKIRAEIQATAARKGVGNELGNCSRSTIWRIWKTHNCEEGKCQLKTHARIINEADPRNAYTMACMLWAFCAILSACMCYNWDATQFYMSDDVSDMAVYIKGDSCRVPLTRESSGGLGVSIKYYHFHNAAGEAAPAVYVIADESFSEGEFFVLPIIGLGNSTEVGSKGYLCWCKTRNCNDSFYRWYAKEIVVPFVQRVREVHQEKNDDGTDMRAFVMCDGEESQIRVFQELAIRQLFRDNLIDFGKTPASCSAILQSSDVSMFFKATKQVLKNIQTQPYKSAILERNLKTAFVHCRQRNGPDTVAGMSSAMESKIINGLQQIVFVIHKELCPDIIKKGYIECGQDAPISLDDNGQLTYQKYEQCIRKCTRLLATAEVETMREHFEHFVGIMRQRGKITEAEMDEKGIPNYNHHDTDKKPKDQRALHKQRATVMNADDVVQQFIDYQQLRTTHRLQMEQRRAARAATAGQREAAKLAREAEKRRRQGLTDEEKRAEANAKRRATAERKRLERLEQQNQQHQLPQQQQQPEHPDGGDSDDMDDLVDEGPYHDSGSEDNWSINGDNWLLRNRTEEEIV